MYAKLFSRITESSLIEESITTRWVFVGLLAIADLDGTVIGTDIAIARRLNVPLREFEQSIKDLMKADPNSNNTDRGGSRVVRSEGERGYFLTGYQRYRSLKTQDERRMYMRKYMSDKRLKEKELNGDVNNVNSELAQLTHAEAAKKQIQPPPGFIEFWNVYPKRIAKGRALKAWRKINPGPELVEKIKISVSAQCQSPGWKKDGGQFIPHPATWLNDEGWNNEIMVQARPLENI